MTAAIPGFARHDLVRVAPEDWAAALARSPAVAALAGGASAVVAAWASFGRPVIVRRRAEGEAPDMLPLGLPFPPRLGKLRLALSLPATAPVVPVAPPSVTAALAKAPPAWAKVGRALEALGDDVGVVPRPFGAALWAAVTGLDYLGPASDLDVLWPVSGGADLPRLLDGLARIDDQGPVPIDGEILLPDGAGVHWRELDRARREPNGTVLAKAVDGVSLRRADALFTG